MSQTTYDFTNKSHWIMPSTEHSIKIQHYVSSCRSQDNLFIWLNLYIRTNPSDPYVLRHWIYLLYLTVEQSWEASFLSSCTSCLEQLSGELIQNWLRLAAHFQKQYDLKTFLYRRDITYSQCQSDYSVSLEFGATHVMYKLHFVVSYLQLLCIPTFRVTFLALNGSAPVYLSS